MRGGQIMLKKYDPDGVYKPIAAYHHCVEVPAGARWLVTAGQVGMAPDGELVQDPEEQIAQTWKNVAALLAAADMGPEDLVKLTIYLLNADDLVSNRKYRAEYLGDAKCASTAVMISGLADPAMVIEVDVMAAKV
jgi:2-iminobutanoate/2-iminopropanoate deaminase